MNEARVFEKVEVTGSRDFSTGDFRRTRSGWSRRAAGRRTRATQNGIPTDKRAGRALDGKRAARLMCIITSFRRFRALWAIRSGRPRCRSIKWINIILPRRCCR